MTKLIVRVDKYAGEGDFYYDDRRYYFKGKQPQFGKLITIKKLPLLFIKIRSNNWDYTKLEDFIDSKSAIYRIEKDDFTFEEWQKFIEKKLPLVDSEILALLSSGEMRTIEKGNESLQKIGVIHNNVPETLRQIANDKIQSILFEKEKHLLNDLEKKTVDDLLSLLVKLKAHKSSQILEEHLLRRIKEKSARIMPEGIGVLQKIAGNKKAHKKLSWEFNSKMNDYKLILPQNTKNDIIDITKAKEERISFMWALLTAKRIGSITIGRKALVVYDRNYRSVTYIKGDRRLKFETAAKGGKYRRLGNTLVLSQKGVRKILLDIEEIDALSYLNPTMVIERLKSEKLSYNDLEPLIVKITEDYTASRILADNAIERLFSIDPVIAKNLSRAYRYTY